MSQTPVQKHFTILDVAADWHELIIPQQIMQPSRLSVLANRWTDGPGIPPPGPTPGLLLNPRHCSQMFYISNRKISDKHTDTDRQTDTRAHRHTERGIDKYTELHSQS